MITLTDENFGREILNAPKPVLVDFWMFNCSPCFVLGSILEKLAEEYKEKIILAKVNVETAPLACQKYGIAATPTIILFNEGEPISQFVGLKPEPAIKQWLEENLRDDSEGVKNLIKEYEEYASENGFKLNSNRKVVEGIVKSLLEREKKFGKRHCPCRRIAGDVEEYKKIICPCVFHREEIKKDGYCLCGLFVK